MKLIFYKPYINFIKSTINTFRIEQCRGREGERERERERESERERKERGRELQ